MNALPLFQDIIFHIVPHLLKKQLTILSASDKTTLALIRQNSQVLYTRCQHQQPHNKLINYERQLQTSWFEYGKPVWTEYGGGLNSARKEWYDRQGRLHSAGDEPACIFVEGTKWWFCHGLRHREGGKPAIECPDGAKQWWINGRLEKQEGYPEEEEELDFDDNVESDWIDYEDGGNFSDDY